MALPGELYFNTTNKKQEELEETERRKAWEGGTSNSGGGVKWKKGEQRNIIWRRRTRRCKWVESVGLPIHPLPSSPALPPPLPSWAMGMKRQLVTVCTTGHTVPPCVSTISFMVARGSGRRYRFCNISTLWVEMIRLWEWIKYKSIVYCDVNAPFWLKIRTWNL